MLIDPTDIMRTISVQIIPLQQILWHKQIMLIITDFSVYLSDYSGKNLWIHYVVQRQVCADDFVCSAINSQMLSRENVYMIKQMRQQGTYIVDIATHTGSELLPACVVG